MATLEAVNMLTTANAGKDFAVDGKPLAFLGININEDTFKLKNFL